ncbi:MAG: 2TM domain-containing protein [Maribacter sp.]
MKNTNGNKYIKVKDKIKKIKNFRWFVLVVILASAYMIGFSIFLYNQEAAYSFVPITIFLASTLGLWVIVLFEYVKIFKNNFFFGKIWEERQIQKFIKENK